MPPSVLPRHLLGEALSKLERLSSYIYELIDKFFPREAHRMKEFVRKRVEGAREILVHASERVAGLRRVSDNAFMLVFVSSKSAGKPVSLAPRVYRSLTGGIEKLPPRGVEEAVYYVEIGPYALKCTCPDAVYTAARADERLAALGFPPQAYKYSLCKHILAGLALLWARGEIDPTRPPFDEAILRALVTVYLAGLPKGRKPRVSRIALVYTRSSDATPSLLN